MKVTLMNHTEKAKELLIFSKRTRHMTSIDAWDEVLKMTEEDKYKELDYVFNTIGSSWEFVDYTFLIEDVTRAFCLEKGTKVIYRKPIPKSKRGNKWIQNIKNIEDFAVGDEVLSYNVESGKKEYDKVIFTSKHPSNDWHEVSFDDGSKLSMTGEHPVYIVGREGVESMKPSWIPANQLKQGDEALFTSYMGCANKSRIGKTYEEIFGDAIAEKIKASVSKSSKRSYTERFGDKAADEINKRTKHLVGKSYEDLYGKEKADQIKEMRREQALNSSNLPDESYLKHLWKNEREKMVDVARKAGIKSVSQHFGKMSKAEETLADVIDKACPGEFKYNGTGDIGAIGYRLPDFINVNGKKKVIEMFGCYWHSCPTCGKDGPPHKNDKRIHSDYKKVGYECLIVWEHELNDLKQVAKKIKTFVHNPNVKIIKVTSVEKSSIWRDSYNIETEKNHNFFAEGILTHNTHQLVRHRVGVAFAQQAQRVADMSSFKYLATGECEDNDTYHLTMDYIDDGYSKLIKDGVRVQDARGVLPTNVLTNILFKVNLRAISDLMLVRLCVRAQGEFQNVAREMQKEIIKVHPWAGQILGPNCVRHGVCKFPKFADCPIKKKFPVLNGITNEDRAAMRNEWVKLKGFDPQPTAHSWKE